MRFERHDGTADGSPGAISYSCKDSGEEEEGEEEEEEEEEEEGGEGNCSGEDWGEGCNSPPLPESQLPPLPESQLPPLPESQPPEMQPLASSFSGLFFLVLLQALLRFRFPVLAAEPRLRRDDMAPMWCFQLHPATPRLPPSLW